MTSLNDASSNKENLHLWQDRNFVLKSEAKLSPADVAEIHRNNIEHLKTAGFLNNLDKGTLEFALKKETKRYNAIVDEPDKTKGLNNFAEEAVAIATGCRNVSAKWKSGLTMEKILNLPSIQHALIKNQSFSEDLILEKQIEKYGHLRLVKDKSNSTTPKHTENKSTNPGNSHNSSNNSVQRKLEVGKTNSTNNYKFVSKNLELNNAVKRQRIIEKDDDEDMDIDTESTKPKFAFKSAREQFDLNKNKKYQKSSPQQGKKSLGSRPRNQCFAKFVPPTTSDQKENNGESSGRYNNTSENMQGLDPRLKGIDPQLVELVMSEIMDHGAPIHWDDIAGLQYAKDTIKEIVIWPMLRPDIFTGLRGPPKGILLFGPPGTGKTLIGKCIANESCATFFSISASSLTSKWIGQGEKMVRALFAVANLHQPAVIFIDEIDSLLSQRSDTEHESSRRIKTEFLVQLDGATTSSEDRILVVGATNRPQEIDEAARRRLVKRLYIPLPDPEARKQIVIRLMEQQLYQLSDKEINSVVDKTDGYSGADVTNLCKEAALGPIRSLQVIDISQISKDDVRPIQVQDFYKALTRVKASVSQKDLVLYSEWNKTFGCGTL